MRILLMGNPNVGKSVIFGLLTGKYVTVSNYPGTTVEIIQGRFSFGRKDTVVVDAPGVNSLVPHSEDERVARDLLLQTKPKLVVHVTDAKSLRKNLLVTLQLSEMGLPLVLDLNMSDEARQKAIYIDKKKLSELLGIGVVETVATEKIGVHQLIHNIGQAKASRLRIDYPMEIEEALEEISDLLPELTISKRSASLLLLASDETLKKYLISHGINRENLFKIEGVIRKTQSNFGQPLSYIINKTRRDKIDRIANQVLQIEQAIGRAVTEKLGRWLMDPILGLPLLLLVLYFLYKFVGQFGAGTSVDFLEDVVFGNFLNPFFTRIVNLTIPFELAREALIGEYGLISMGLTYSIAIVLPIVGTFFLSFGILEDCGYLPRLAVMANRTLKKIGLSGKAVLPLVLGLGCDTMATLTTRILDTKRERVIATLLLALGIPCSAQLGVILGMLGAISFKALAVVLGVLAICLLLVGYLASKVLRGENSDFLLEIPPIRIPKISNILTKTVLRLKWFLKEAVPLFLYGTFVLFVLDKLGILLAIERLASPIVSGFLSLPAKATEAFIVGFLRRDYGAAGLYQLARIGKLSNNQVVVSIVVITLFVPCIANLFVIIKERGLKQALYIVSFIIPFAILVGGALNFLIRTFEVTF